MSKFKTGDKVRCIDDSSFYYDINTPKQLIINRIYTVSKINKNIKVIHLKEDEFGKGWDYQRFVKIEPDYLKIKVRKLKKLINKGV